MDGQHPVDPGLQGGRPGDELAGLVPVELHVALVAGHHDAPGPGPGHGVADRPGGALGPARVAGLVEPQQQGPGGVLLGDGGEVEVPAVAERDGHGPAAAELRPHGVGRVRHCRVEDGVAGRVP